MEKESCAAVLIHCILLIELCRVYKTVNMIKILIADDHSIVRKGLLYQCGTVFGYREIDEVCDGNQMMEALKRFDYTHLILDLVMSDGNSMDIVGTIRRLYPHLNILIFTAKPRGIYGFALEQYGIRYYIEKDAPENLTIQLLREFLESTENSPNPAPKYHYSSVFSMLTKRETEVLHYWLEGLTTRQIAKQLNLADESVSTYKKRISEKTNTKSTKELQELAALHGFKG
jgi:DNA-binding NarL/FixJ family response regulator